MMSDRDSEEELALGREGDFEFAKRPHQVNRLALS
jgi:hypothetical protein